jgi:hypothetical protein
MYIAGMRAPHLLGLFLWRGGLLLAGVAAAVESMRLLLRFVDLPDQLEIGVALVLAGAALVLLSLILERAADRRLEGDLRE